MNLSITIGTKSEPVRYGQRIKLPVSRIEANRRGVLSGGFAGMHRARRGSRRAQPLLLVFIDPRGEIASVHRKLMPTYEERLVWSPGDGHGLRTHPLRAFHVGGLNCWENWMLLSRAALRSEARRV